MERTVLLWWPFGSHKLRTSGKGLLRPGRICEAISFYSRTDVLWYFWGWRIHSGTQAMWPMQMYLWCMYPYVIFYDTLILIFYWPNSLTYSYGFSAQSLHFVQPAINWCIEGFGQQHHWPPDISDFFMLEFVFGQQQKTLFVNNSNSLQTVFMFEFVSSVRSSSGYHGLLHTRSAQPTFSDFSNSSDSKVKVKVKVKGPNMCYIFEKHGIQGYRIWHSRVSNVKYTITQIHK